MYSLIKKVLFHLPPEAAHEWVCGIGRFLPGRPLGRLTRPPLNIRTTFAGVTLQSPIGLAAGFDKNGEIIDFMGALGFGFVEIGSVTARPCAGNPKPRLFRLPRDASLVNRLGLPNWGAERIAAHLEKSRPRTPYGVNIAVTPGARDGLGDIMACLKIMHRFGCYLTLNLSCPNTPAGKTFEDPAEFALLARAVADFRQKTNSTKPVLIKISPDSDEGNLKKLIAVALEAGFDGTVVSNTTLRRDGLMEKALAGEAGGLSGRGLAQAANHAQKIVHALVGGRQTIIASGGVMDFSTLREKLKWGASLVQVYTGLIYNGPWFIRQLNRELSRDRDAVRQK